MKDADLKLNASGIYDETAYKAITTTPGGLAPNGEAISAGEVWTIDTGCGRRILLTLQVFGTFATGMFLFDTIRAENNYPVDVNDARLWGDTGKLSFAFYDKFRERTFVPSAEVMADVRRVIAQTLELDAPAAECADTKEVKELHYEIDRLIRENNDLKQQLAAAQPAVGDTELAVLRKENEIYKQMYYEVLGKLLER